MKKDSKLRKLIDDITKDQNESNPKINLVEKLHERKGFSIIEIDNDNGMCQYDYQYNS